MFHQIVYQTVDIDKDLYLSNFEINYPFKNNLLLVHFELSSKFFQQWKCSLKLKYAIYSKFIFFHSFQGKYAPIPPKDGDAHCIPFEG